MIRAVIKKNTEKTLINENFILLKEVEEDFFFLFHRDFFIKKRFKKNTV